MAHFVQFECKKLRSDQFPYDVEYLICDFVARRQIVIWCVIQMQQ